VALRRSGWRTHNSETARIDLGQKLELWGFADYYVYFIVKQQYTGQAQTQRRDSDRLRSLLGDLFLLTITLALSGYSTPPSRARTRADGPEVSMALTRRDFGDVFAGKELEQNFPVRNTGTKPLELERKSMLGARSTAPGYAVRAAVWRPNDQLLPRTVAARRAAPS